MKYIIEIEDNPVRCLDGTLLWKAKGFNSLVFDVNGLAKMKKVTENPVEGITEKKCDGCIARKNNPYLCQQCVRNFRDYYATIVSGGFE